MKKFLIITLLVFISFSCSKKEKEKIGAEFSYDKAMKLLKNKDYPKAAEEFEKIDDDFPFSQWAIKGQTMAVYARYKDEDYDKLFAVIDDFVRLYPNSEYMPYMLYMKGLSYYNKIPNIERAQDFTKESSYTFRELIARFPQTDYAEDARSKIEFIDEHLAGAKMSIGRYQIRNENYLGAIDNFSEVINRHHQTKQVPEAYFHLNEIYSKIGLKEEAQKAKNQLETRFSQSYWNQLAKDSNKW